MIRCPERSPAGLLLRRFETAVQVHATDRNSLELKWEEPPNSLWHLDEPAQIFHPTRLTTSKSLLAGETEEFGLLTFENQFLPTAESIAEHHKRPRFECSGKRPKERFEFQTWFHQQSKNSRV